MREARGYHDWGSPMNQPIWHVSYPPDVPLTINPDAHPTVHAMLIEACEQHAARSAFDCLGATLTFAEWERLSGSFAAFLIEGINRKLGDRIALMVPNMFAYPVAFLGSLRAGLTVVNVNPLYTPRELEYQLNDSGATAIVIMENFAHKLQDVIAKTDIDHVIVTRVGDFMPMIEQKFFNLANKYFKRAVPSWDFQHFSMLADACNHSIGEGFTDAHPPSNAAALLQYTGGTTGVPKGALISHRNLVANTMQCCAWIGSRLEVGAERILTPLPLYHIFALTANLLTFANIGALNVLVPDPRDLRALVTTMRRTQITVVSGVNTLFNALANNQDFQKLDFTKMKFAIAGGAAVQKSVASRWQDITKMPLVEGYGLTEASPVVCINPLQAARIGTVGVPVPSTEVSIRDDAGRVVAIGEAGEVWVRGPQVMQGYWRRPDETKHILTSDAWLQTGDIGSMDSEGYVKLLDRKKDMIIVSGFKVFPNELEDVIALHPGVLEVAAIGIPDAKTGQAVKLFVVKRDPALTEAALREYSRDNFAAYKLPKVIEFRDELPKSAIGKVLRKNLA